MPKIFLSHASKDDPEVTPISNWLNEHGFEDHFVDHLHIAGGTSWDLELPKQLSSCEIVIIYLSKSWLASKECLAEYRSSYYGNKVIIPLLVSDQLQDLNAAESEAFQRICSSLQGVSIQDFPPDEVNSQLMIGSLNLAFKEINWSKRKRILRRLTLTAISFLLILTALSFYFREYVKAGIDKFNISYAFEKIHADEFADKFRDIESLSLEDRTFRECKNDQYCPDMIALPAGRFQMGSSDDFEPNSWEWPPQIIDVPSFAVSTYEITQAQWLKCFISTRLDDTNKCKEVSTWQDKTDYPVDSVSWNDVQVYINWLNEKVVGHSNGPYRLLSEAEWEYAVRGKSTLRDFPTIYHWGDNMDNACKFANMRNEPMPPAFQSDILGHKCKSSNPELATNVGKFEPNGFGLYDMAGNMSEWVQDCWHDSYDGRPTDARAWVTQASRECDRVIRGGSWLGLIDNLRSAARSNVGADLFGFNIGFRIARDLNWVPPE